MGVGGARAAPVRIGQYHSSYEHAKFSSPSHLELIRRLYPNLAKSVFLSEDDARSFSRHRVPNARAIGNPLTFEPECVATPGRSRRIVTVGRLATTIKRYDLLIAAFARASDEVPERWELHLVGDGYEEEQLRACAAEHGVTDRVIFQGRCKDVHSHYRDAAIFALSSEHEGHPMALAEAAALGLPAVAFGVSGGVKNLVADGVSGLLAPPGDVGAFADALVRLMRAPELRAQRAAPPVITCASSPSRKSDKWDSLFAGDPALTFPVCLPGEVRRRTFLTCHPGEVRYRPAGRGRRAVPVRRRPSRDDLPNTARRRRLVVATESILSVTFFLRGEINGTQAGHAATYRLRAAAFRVPREVP